MDDGAKNQHLYILWTNADPVTTEKMVFMYGLNSKLQNWWQEVTIIIWGATARLVTVDERIQEKIKEMTHAGVEFSACKACADQLGATDTLVELGVEVKYWGEPLTDIIKDGGRLITI